MTLETIVDNLRNGYGQLKPGTFLHADQLTAEQVQDASLRKQPFYVADGALYSLEGKKKTPTLGLTREDHNLVLRHLNDKVDSSYDQLVNTGNFRPNPEEARKSMRAKGTLRVDLTKLRLQGDDNEWSYLYINTTDYDSLNAEERKLAERWYGQGKAFASAMKTLNEVGIRTTRVYVLNPSYVNKEAQKGPIGRAAWRSLFYDSAGSGAFGRGVLGRIGVRGVRRASASEPVVAAGDAPKNSVVPSAQSAPQEISIARCYDVLLADEKGAVAALNNARVAGLTRLVADYLATRAQ